MAKIKLLSAQQRSANITSINKSGRLKKKLSLPVYFIVLILAVLARTVQLFTNMDFETGRFMDSSPVKNYTMIILVPGFLLMAFLLFAGSAKDKVAGTCVLINPMRLRYDRVNKRIPHAAGYASLLMALLIFAQIVFDVYEIRWRNLEIVKTLPPDEAEDYNLLTGYTAGTFALHFLMFLVICNFVAVAVNVFKGDGISHGNCAAFTLYGIWKIVELLTLISENPGLSRSSEKLYIMFSYMTAVLFFMNTARFFNGMEKKNTRNWMCLMGYISSILAAVSTIPRYILMLVPLSFTTQERYDNIHEMTLPELSDIGIVFMTITIVVVFWSTFVYRVMPKLNKEGMRRWTRAPMTKKYQDIETIDVIPGKEP